MNRGYLKLWRKIEDSASWSRGLLYQGLMINFLRRANWKVGYFQGKEILPGQFACSYESLAEELKLPKTTIHRMVANLKKDSFIETIPVKHRFTIISVINWSSYQNDESSIGTQMERKRNANGTQTECIKEDKNIRTKKEEYKNPIPHPEGGVTDRSLPSPIDCGGGANPRSKGTSPRSAGTNPRSLAMNGFAEFWAAYPKKTSKTQAEKAWSKAKTKPPLDELLIILERHKASRNWQKDDGEYIPYASTWLNQQRWNDEIESFDNNNDRFAGAI